MERGHNIVYIVLDGVNISILNTKPTPTAIAMDDASACAVLHERNTVECVVEVIPPLPSICLPAPFAVQMLL